MRYDVPVVFVPTPQEGAAKIERWALNFVREAVTAINDLWRASRTKVLRYRELERCKTVLQTREAFGQLPLLDRKVRMQRVIECYSEPEKRG
jgi:hypothetical protein